VGLANQQLHWGLLQGHDRTAGHPPTKEAILTSSSDTIGSQIGKRTLSRVIQDAPTTETTITYADQSILPGRGRVSILLSESIDIYKPTASNGDSEVLAEIRLRMADSYSDHAFFARQFGNLFEVSLNSVHDLGRRSPPTVHPSDTSPRTKILSDLLRGLFRHYREWSLRCACK
jgi:hypothetical protein